jgi:hypothetical protein
LGSLEAFRRGFLIMVNAALTGRRRHRPFAQLDFLQSAKAIFAIAFGWRLNAVWMAFGAHLDPLAWAFYWCGRGLCVSINEF